MGLRIIGGRFRGRKLFYSGQLRVRPMKDRVREAVFNLVGPAVKDTHAIDLFAGTGALGLEALSRGAARATFIEQHYPTAAVLRRNIATLGVESVSEVITANTFVWARRLISPRPLAGEGVGVRGWNLASDARHSLSLGSIPWLVFCSPPYDFYVDRLAEMLNLLSGLMATAPPESGFVVESDVRFDFAALPDAAGWDVRRYPPAVVGVYWPAN